MLFCFTLFINRWNIDWQMTLDVPQPPMKMWDLWHLEDDALVDKACGPRILQLYSIDWNTWNHTTFSEMELNLWKMSCSNFLLHWSGWRLEIRERDIWLSIIRPQLVSILNMLSVLLSGDQREREVTQMMPDPVNIIRPQQVSIFTIRYRFSHYYSLN